MEITHLVLLNTTFLQLVSYAACACLPTAAFRDGGGETAGGQQSDIGRPGGDGEEVQAGEGEVQGGAGGGGEEDGGPAQAAHLPDQEETVGEWNILDTVMVMMIVIMLIYIALFLNSLKNSSHKT